MLVLAFGLIAENSALRAEWINSSLDKGRGFESKGRIPVKSGMRLNLLRDLSKRASHQASYQRRSS